MIYSPLTAISPIDGRYRRSTETLAAYFSEFALIRYRVRVEVEYFLALAAEGIFELPSGMKPKTLRAIYEDFSEADAQMIKDTEKVTNHDVKAVEYFLKEKIAGLGGEDTVEWVHFGLTSQDVNNTATPLLWKEALEGIYLPAIGELLKSLNKLAREWKTVPMLARTHGQPASPTILGKEILVFTERISGQLDAFSHTRYSAKFGGATGAFNAHFIAFPKTDWVKFGNRFVESLGLERAQATTQIEAYDHLASQLDCLKRIHTILIDFCRDIWTYISMDYFKQKTKEGEIGSSAMPHKVNPIDFENAEGNLGIANALCEHLAAKLPISRLQRDLTDSTVLRNLGIPVAHGLLAVKAIQKGLGKLVLNTQNLDADLESNWAVVSEAVQTILRREGYPKPYEALKDLTRGKGSFTQTDLHNFIETLNVSDAVKRELAAITPGNYTGITMKYD